MKRTLTILGMMLVLLLCACLLASCGDKAEVTTSAITSAIVNKQGSEITVKAVLTEADLEQIRENSGNYNQKLYLIALEPGETKDNLTGKKHVAQASLSETPKFSFDVYDEGNFQAHSRLHCSFVVAVYHKATQSYVAQTDPVYVSNVDVLAENKSEFPTSASIKGLHATISSDAALLGVAHTVLELDPTELILDGYSDNAISYVYDGQTYYLDRGKLEELDKQVTEYSAQGSIVYFRLRITDPDEKKEIASSLYVGQDKSKPLAYGIWLDDAQSASLMAGFLDFIAARYTDPAGTHGFCGALIIGRSVNESAKNNYVGMVEFNEYVQKYHALVRLAHSTLKSHYANGRVYVSVSNNLNDYEAIASKSDFTTNSFLEEFNKQAIASGDFDWSVAISAYAYGKNSADPMWSDEHATALKLSPAHLSDFTWITQSDHYYNGKHRNIIISDFEVAPNENPNVQAASYAYAYYKVLEYRDKNGDKYVDALIYSAHTDARSLIADSGLWDTDKNNNITQKRALYDVFRTIDTKDTSVLDALGLSNQTGWKTLFDAQFPNAATRQHVTGNKVSKPTTKGRVLFSFTDGTLCNFTPDDSVAYLELTRAEEIGGWSVLRAQLDHKQPGTYMGISNTTLQGSEIKGSKNVTIALTMCVAADVPEGSTVKVKLRLLKQGSSTLSTGNGQLVYEIFADDIQPNTWQTIYFDVTEFTSRVDGDDPITVSVLIDAPELVQDGECALLLDRVEIYGAGGVQFYEVLIIVAAIVLVLCLIVGLVILLYYKYGAPNIIANIFWNVSKGKIRLRRFKKTPKETPKQTPKETR